MSIKSESIATQLILKMDEAIEKKDRDAFMAALKDERLHNCIVEMSNMRTTCSRFAGVP